MTAQNVLDNIRTREMQATLPMERRFLTTLRAEISWSIHCDVNKGDLIKREEETAKKNILHLFYGGYIPQLEEIINLADRIQHGYGLSIESREQAREIVKRIVKLRNEMEGRA